METHRVLVGSDGSQHVSLARGHDRFDALYILERLDILIRQAHRRNNADIVEVRAVEVLVGGQAHVGARHAKTGVKARSQRSNDRNGQKAPEGMGDRANNLFSERASHGRLPLDVLSGRRVRVQLHSGHFALANVNDAVGDGRKSLIVRDEHDRAAGRAACVL